MRYIDTKEFMKKMLLVQPTTIILLLLNMLNCNANGNVSVPTKAVIESDLVGRRLSEGIDNGYFPLDWSWMVEQGQISGLTIISQDVASDYCSFVVSMTLQKMSSPTKYHATVQMDYSLLNKKWQLVLVKSKGVKIVRTGKYLDCIVARIPENSSYIAIQNKVDSPLLVGGVYLSYSSKEWERFSKVVDGLSTTKIRESATNFKIHFVEPL